jgi:hypothetical protein
MWLTARHKADLRREREERVMSATMADTVLKQQHVRAVRARLARRKVYNAKPDLPGMCKRDRRFGYPWWRSRYGESACIIRRRPNRTARHRDRDEPPKRELKPRPPAPKRNPHGYHRERERAEARTIVRETFG